MRSVVVTSTFTLSSSPAVVWPLITDTDRTNRLVLGTSNVYKPVEKGLKSAARFVVETKALGIPISYEEAPFEWTLNKRFSVFRKMRSGPLESYTYGITLDPADGGGTRVTMRLDLVPRHWALRPVAQIEGKRIVARMAKVAASIDAHIRDHAPSPYLKPSSPANEARLVHGLRELRKRDLDSKAVETLAALIRDGADADLVRIRPFELAAERGVDEREMLRACLHATTLGVVELRWALVCPSCRTANDQVTSLADLSDNGHCQLCDLSYGIELDRAVEATFVPHPSVREVSNAMFCIGGPFRTPHVVVQATIDERQTKKLEAPAEIARYRLFARGGVIASVEIAADAPEDVRVVLRKDGFSPSEFRVAPGGNVTVENTTENPLHVKIERLGYATKAAHGPPRHDDERVPPVLFEGSAEAEHAAEGRALRDPVQRSHRLDRALHPRRRRGRVPPRRRPLRRAPQGHRRARGRRGEDDGRRDHGRVHRAGRVPPRGGRLPPCVRDVPRRREQRRADGPEARALRRALLRRDRERRDRLLRADRELRRPRAALRAVGRDRLRGGALGPPRRGRPRRAPSRRAGAGAGEGRVPSRSGSCA